ncbi:MAG TPA: hypothetical protein VKT73_13020 [Xanthobacteraceae bacterium]|nr:hypothetical protein [Xanthobacteraceae bacterium]
MGLPKTIYVKMDGDGDDAILIADENVAPLLDPSDIEDGIEVGTYQLVETKNAKFQVVTEPVKET